MKHFLRKKLFSGALLFLCVAMLGGGIVVYAQNSLTIDKDIILSPGKVIRFPDSSTLDSASAIGGGGWTATSTKIYPQAATYVGIGTTNPTSPLYVVGTTTIAGVLQVGAGGGLGEAATSTIIYRSQFVDSDNTAYYLDPAATGNSAIFAGKVGIGVTAPTGKLDVSGGYINIFNAEASAGTWRLGAVNGIVGSYSPGVTGIRADGGLKLAGRSVDVSASPDVIINTSGYVGIGTASPASKLTIDGSGETVVKLQNAGTEFGELGTYSSGFIIGTNTSNSLFLETGNAVRATITGAGNVGIGLTNPTYKFQVTGQIYADEGTAAADIIANKIDGVTFDPVYTIEGKRYATYMPGMVGGVKEELSDVATLVAISNDEFRMTNEKLYSYTIDLNSEEKGSDEWLFAHTIDVEKNGLKYVTVLLTPNFDGKVWYEKDSVNNKIIIFGTPNPKTLAPVGYEVSYRLTAPRFDSKDWTNYSSSEWEGLNFDTYYKKAN